MIVAEYFIVTALMFRMVHCFLPPVGRLFTWPMYAYATLVVGWLISEGEHGDAGVADRIDYYRVLPRGEFGVSPDELDLVIQYLRQSGVLVSDVEGFGYGEFGEAALHLEDGHVVLELPN